MKTYAMNRFGLIAKAVAVLQGWQIARYTTGRGSDVALPA
jgi:hypothetical protein